MVLHVTDEYSTEREYCFDFVKLTCMMIVVMLHLLTLSL